MTSEERCRNTSYQLDSRIEETFDKFVDVFAEDLAGGKTMKVPMDITLDEEIAAEEDTGANSCFISTG